MGFDKEEAAAASWRYSLALPHASPESEAINKAVRDSQLDSRKIVKMCTEELERSDSVSASVHAPGFSRGAMREAGRHIRAAGWSVRVNGEWLELSEPKPEPKPEPEPA